MTSSSHETCLLCLQINANTINFNSQTGIELNIISILSTHFWFQLDEIKVLSQNICRECWKKTESFHDFYQSIQLAHKKFETVFVKIENDLDAEAEEGIYLPPQEICQSVEETHRPVEKTDQLEQVPHDNFITSYVKIESNRDVEDDESSDTSVCEVPYTNSIDTETRAFDAFSKKTKHSYLNAYKKFSLWKAAENIDKDCFSEAVMLEYFHYLKSKYKPSTLYGKFSMLRTTIQKNDNVDISYPEVMLMLKKSSEGFHSQKSNVFQPDEIQRFFSEAPDFQFLTVKVVMIFFLYGIRSDSLTNVDVNDVIEQGSVIVIKIPDTKTNTMISFTVENEYAACVQKYKNLRPPNVPHDRFFLNYQKGKCTLQPIGKNKFLNTPKTIANFLKLENPEGYTWYSFRGESSKRGKIGELNSKEINVERPTEGTEATNASSLEAPTVALDSLSEKTQMKYLRSYDKFMDWKVDENIDKDCFSEAVLLDYFHYLKTKYKPTSLWTVYSMLKTTIQRNNNIDIAYPELKQFLKARSFGYLSQKTLIFQPAEIRRFLYEADDYEFLGVKVLIIFGIYGVTSVHELTKVDVQDISQQGSVFTIKIPDGKTKFSHSFTVDDEYAPYLQNYMQLRPEDTAHSRFFINYQNGKCTPESIGINKLRSAPKFVANFLNLKDSASYTCHSFYTKPLKFTRGTRSSKVLNSYIQECLPKKRKISDVNSEEINSEKSTEAVDTSAALTTINIICEDVKDPVWDFLPEKSRERYVRSYENFLIWKADEKVDKECFSEEVMVKYCNYLKTKNNPASLWQKYSMLRTTVHKRDNIDISYPAVKSLLKTNSIGFQRKKVEVLQPEEVMRFLSEAEDIKYLSTKVITIFVFYGKVRPDELIKIEVKDVIQQDSGFAINIRDAKSNAIRSFTVYNEHAAYIQKYKNLRPKSVPHRRFFINYQKGKCTIQPIGANMVWSAPKVIAKFLNLEDADNYLLRSLIREPKILKKSKKLSTDYRDDTLSTKVIYHDVSSSDADNYILESEQIDLKRSTEAMVTSTITSSMNTSAVANTLNIPTTFQTYHAQSNQVQPYQLLPYAVGAVNTRTNDAYIQPDEKMLWGMQFNNFHNL